jgi:hypothetical protein
LDEGCKLKMLQNKILRKIIGVNENKMRKSEILNNEKLCPR